MSCLFEFLFEVVGEVVLEGLLHAYLYLMLLIVPEEKVTDKVKRRLRTGMKTWAGLSLVLMIVGGILYVGAAEESAVLATVGQWMLFVPLGLCGVQIVLGLVVALLRGIDKRRGKHEE